MRTLTLSYPHLSAKHAGYDYLVMQVEQSTDYKPGELLDEETVKGLCESRGTWKVVVKVNHSR
jgi:hypothetical protein